MIEPVEIAWGLVGVGLGMLVLIGGGLGLMVLSISRLRTSYGNLPPALIGYVAGVLMLVAGFVLPLVLYPR